MFEYSVIKIAHRTLFGFAVIDILLKFFFGNGTFEQCVAELTKGRSRETCCLQIIKCAEFVNLFCYVMLCYVSV